MKKVALLATCGLLSGCDFNVPLVAEPKLDADASIVGLWERSQDGEDRENLLVLPLNAREQLVSFPANDKMSMFAKACLCRAGDMTLMQLKWFGTAKGGVPDDARVYQLASYSVAGGKLTARLLNADVVGRDHATTEELARAILAAKGDPKLFQEEMVFARVAPE